MPESRIAHPELAPEGHRKIAWAWASMPVLRLIHEKYRESLPFRGTTIGACLHLEAKTACLLKVLKDLGATVAAAAIPCPHRTMFARPLSRTGSRSSAGGAWILPNTSKTSGPWPG